MHEPLDATAVLTSPRGKPLNVQVTGELKKDIEAGSKVHLEVSAGVLKKNFDFDVCEKLVEYKDKLRGAEPLSCPIRAGKKTWEETILLPAVNLPLVSRSCTCILIHNPYQKLVPQRDQR
jgi:hypothetical protein